MLEDVLPKIHEKWPPEDVEKVIFIQQDNARTHVAPSDGEFQVAASHNVFDIRLMCQPPNSPYLNVFDLELFSAIQALQHKVCPKNIEEYIFRRIFYEKDKTHFLNFATLHICKKQWELEGLITIKSHT